MRAFIWARLKQLAIVQFILSFVLFGLMKLAPGDPVFTLLRADEMGATQADETELREKLGFNMPLYKQYGLWLMQVIRLDLGDSLFKNKSVMALFLERLPATIQLASGGLTVMLLIALPLGLLSARFPGSLVDQLGRMFSTLGASVPVFWIGLLFIYLFAYKLDWLPAMGYGGLRPLILPSITLGFGLAAVHARLLRTGMLESLSSEYVRAARARGLSEKRIYVWYAMRASLIPVLTVFGMTLGSLIAGSVVVETIFAWPGLGQMAVEAIFQRDYPLVQGYLLMTGAFIMIVNGAVDLLYGMIDPRIRLSQ